MGLVSRAEESSLGEVNVVEVGDGVVDGVGTSTSGQNPRRMYYKLSIHNRKV